MNYTRVNYATIEDKSGLYFLRDALSCTELGVSVIDVKDGRDGFEHDHAEDAEEEVYLLIDGSATLTVDGEALSLEPGDAVRVDPEANRKADLHGTSLMIVVGAP